MRQAVEQVRINLSVRLPKGINVDVDGTGIESDRSRLGMMNAGRGTITRPSGDILHIRDVVAAELGRQGYRAPAQVLILNC
ncbi:MAG: hypothetical protein CV088_17345 [Nitrospira sp. LK70]|nr:hypothetical protein [Nitrospira sp. LK70]